jgi:diacylglycerol kinase (ATP)
MLKKRLNSFKFAFAGIRDLFKTEPNAIIHLAAAIFAVGLGFFFSISKAEWCFVVFSIVFVFSAEALNTAIEHLTNLVSPDYNELAGKTKDAAAAAVLFAAIGSAIVGLIIFLPKIFTLLGLTL